MSISIRNATPYRVASGLAVRLSAAAALAALTGCVSSGTYDAVEKERDALARERTELARQVDDLTRSQQQLIQDVEAKNRRIAELAAIQERLSGELESEVAARQVEIERLVDGVRLNVSDELLFPSGSAELGPGARKVLGRIVSQLEPQEQIISVVGHADAYMLPERLRDKYPTNWELAAARASIVVRVLSEAGIPPTSLRAVSRGPFDPIAPNTTPQGRAKNRRTEIVVRPKLDAS